MKTLLILLFATVAFGGEIRVIDRVPEPPIEVPANLTEAEFRAWAKKYNANQLKAAKKRYKAYLKERGHLQTVDHFDIQIEREGSSLSGLGSSLYGGSNCRLSTGDSPHTSMTLTRQKYTQTYRDLNDNGGGPVTFINPFCYENYAR